MKVIRKDKILDNDLIDNIVKEKQALQNTDHPFLVHMRYGFSTEERLFFVMDFVRGGDLYSYL
jgi:serine/threonine protein kinase